MLAMTSGPWMKALESQENISQLDSWQHLHLLTRQMKYKPFWPCCGCCFLDPDQELTGIL